MSLYPGHLCVCSCSPDSSTPSVLVLQIAPPHLRFTLTFSTHGNRILAYIDTLAFADTPKIRGSQRSDLLGLFPCLSLLTCDGAVSEIWDLRLLTCPCE
ncbi:hypothetical protein E2542_SST11449 [Spatholobus suberectus]|nr:hypothetical protein E2542_SST11449 [Spatholobus suberectus]